MSCAEASKVLGLDGEALGHALGARIEATVHQLRDARPVQPEVGTARDAAPFAA